MGSVEQSLERLFILRPPRQTSEFLSFEGQLGKGAFGTVYRGRATEECLRTASFLEAGTPYAVKRVERPRRGFAEEIGRSLLANSPERHVEFLRSVSSCSSEHVIRFHAFFMEMGTAIFQVMELLEGPDLFDFLNGRVVGIPEPDAAGLTRQILLAIHHLHRTVGALHRDIKPENFGFAAPVASGQRPLPALKLFDLGLACVLAEPVATEESARALWPLGRAGTAAYMAPESWGGLGGPPCDVWGAGTVAYALLSLQLPFGLLGQRGRADPARAVREAPLAFSGRAWATVREAPRRLLAALLEKDPRARATTAEALADPWLRSPPAAVTPTGDADAAPAAPCVASEPLELPARSGGGSGSQALWQSVLCGSERFLSVGSPARVGRA